MATVDYINNGTRNDEESTLLSSTSSATMSSMDEGDGGPTVAVIGCGPGGMSFLHAVACRRKKLIENNDTDGLRKLPVVTCFERTSLPGGVWRSARSNNKGVKNNISPTSPEKEEDHVENTNELITMTNCFSKNASIPNVTKPTQSNSSRPSTNMYEGLWINGCKEALEYFDYTFDQHFGCESPAFLPRSQVLEYMIARMTQHEDIFNYVQFNTTVNLVSYDHKEKHFCIETINGKNGRSTIRNFDKCIFSGGLNGSPYFPTDIKSMLTTHNFSGHVLHSSEMNYLEEEEGSVKGKRIVLIGDSYSAEDLALQCLKLGASKIYITSKRNRGIASEVGAWPDGMVEIVWYQLPYAVENGNTLLCRYDETDEEVTIISDVSMVIFCTGYNANIGMLSDELNPFEVNDVLEVNVPTFPVPPDWKMNHNYLTNTLGEIDPPPELNENSKFVSYKLYRRMLVENTNMMYIFEYSDYPLMEIDVAAWLCLSYICQDLEIPSVEEMRKRNREEILEEMKSSHRYDLDSNYRNACSNIPEDHWYHDICSEEYKAYLREWGDYEIKVLARQQNDSGYPISFGNEKNLNSSGRQLLEMHLMDSLSRYELTEDGEESKWRTFRDVDPSKYVSLFTGTKAVPLKGRWLDVDNDGNLDVVEANN